MSKTLTVYWSYFTDLYLTPTTNTELAQYSPNYPIRKHMIDKYSKLNNKDDLKNYFRCPASIAPLKNIFGIRSHMDYSFEKIGRTFSSSDDSLERFNDSFLQRESSLDFITLKWRLLLFSKESVDVVMQPGYLEENDFNNNTILLPGQYNISKWLRPLEPTFILNSKKLKIKRGDILYYLKFNTNKKIIFKNFEFNNEIENLVRKSIDLKTYVPNLTLRKLYNLFTGRNFDRRVLKEINNNLTGY